MNSPFILDAASGAEIGGTRILTARTNTLELVALVFLSLLTVAAFVGDGAAALHGVLRIQLMPARLINDFFETGGVGAALLNGVLVGAIGLAMVRLAGIQLSGPTFAAVLTMTGFGLFGKTPLNIVPIVLGVYGAARLMRKPFSNYLIIAMFGTALGPLVSLLAWETGLPAPAALAVALAGGIAAGFLLPAAAVSMLHLHQGYNLYNMGFTCGFLGLFGYALLSGAGVELPASVSWYDGTAPTAWLPVPLLALALIVTGLIKGGHRSLKDFAAIQRIPGRLPSDFTDLASVSGTLINSGLIGLCGSLYVVLVGGSFNGPVVGGLLTIMGFGAFGTHLKNSWPVVTGVVLATLATGNALNAPGPLLAAIFCTTLAPLAGEFGRITGVIAGILHLLMVMQTGAWNGGINLYNNGFAGGLTAALIVSLIQWYRSNRDQIR